MIQAIQVKIRARQYEFSRHALDQSIQRDISISEFEDAMLGDVEIIQGPTCAMRLPQSSATEGHHPVRARSSPVDRFPIETRLLMTESTMQETLIETTVNYTIEYQGQLYLIEQVPARVCQETGEEYFSPDTVEHIQALIKSGRPPARVITTPVYRYA